MAYRLSCSAVYVFNGVADGARNEVNLLRTSITGQCCCAGIRHYTLDVTTYLIRFGTNGPYQTFKYVPCLCSSMDDFLAPLIRFRSTSRICVTRHAFTNRNKCITLISVSHVSKVPTLPNSHQYHDGCDSDDFACLDDSCSSHAACVSVWPILILTSVVYTHHV